MSKLHTRKRNTRKTSIRNEGKQDVPRQTKAKKVARNNGTTSDGEQPFLVLVAADGENEVFEFESRKNQMAFVRIIGKAALAWTV
jgi:hypothetical protein